MTRIASLRAFLGDAEFDVVLKRFVSGSREWETMPQSVLDEDGRLSLADAVTRPKQEVGKPR